MRLPWVSSQSRLLIRAKRTAPATVEMPGANEAGLGRR